MEQRDREFDEEFLVRTFDRFWECGLYNQLWSEMNSTMWVEGALLPHFYDLVDASAAYPELADRWIQGWDYPPDYSTWLLDPDLALQYIAEVRKKHGD